MSLRKLALLLAIAAPLLLTLHTEVAARAAVRTVAVPDFKNKTLAQVQTQVGVPGQPNAMFADIIPQGPSDGVVASQTPVAGTRIVPGYSRLVLTLQAPKPSVLGGILQQILNAPKPQKTDNDTTVPPLIGLTQDVAAQRLQSAYLQGRYTGDTNGLVTQQSLSPGTQVRRGTTVVLSLTQSQVTVPFLNAMTLAEATQRLQQSYLQLGTVQGSNDDTATVSAQALPPGAQVPRGTAVGVTMQAPATAIVTPPLPTEITVPNLLGMTSTEASEALTSLKLTPLRTRGPTTGLVSAQTKAPGTSVAPGTRIGYTLSARQVAVPDLLNDNANAAAGALTSLGLKPTFAYAPNVDRTASLIVTSQDPAAETMVDEGTNVTITMDQPSTSSKVIATVRSIPPWVGIVTLAGLAVIGRLAFRKRPTIPKESVAQTPPASVCTLTTSTVYPAINPSTLGGPSIHFTITLRDEVPPPQYNATEPTITRRG